MKKLLFTLCVLIGLASLAFSQVNEVSIEGNQTITGSKKFTGTTTASNLNNVLVVDGTTYPQTLAGVQSALNAASAGQKVIIPGPQTYSGSGSVLSIPAGIDVECTGQATLNFSGVGTSTNLITIAAAYPPYRNSFKGCVIAANAVGQDALRLNGGDHLTLENLYITDANRDFFSFIPDANFHWFENVRLLNLRSQYIAAPSANARDAYHFEIPTGLTNVYMNKFVMITGNIRGYVRNAWRMTINNSGVCVACGFANWTIEDLETDSGGHMSSTANPAIYFDRVAGNGVSFQSITFIGGSFEDTIVTPTGSIFSAATTASTGNGLTLLGSVNGNYPKFYDASFFTNYTNVMQFDQNGFVTSNPFQWWKDSTPSQAVSYGNSVPGGALGNDATISIFNSGAWNARFVAQAAGGYSFKTTTGTSIHAIDNSGNVYMYPAGVQTLTLTTTAPTITGHFNTSGDSISANNGTVAFTVTVGTGVAGSTGTIGLPTASTGWNCYAANRNRGAYIQQTASTTASATFTNYGTTVGTPVNWTNSDVLAVSCFAY